MAFPDTLEEFMESYKITDTEQVYTNGVELVPIFRIKQWMEHEKMLNNINREKVYDACVKNKKMLREGVYAIQYVLLPEMVDSIIDCAVEEAVSKMKSQLVVLCKNCKYSDRGIDEEGKPFIKCIGHHYGGTKEDNFCNYGELKDENK